MRDRKRELKAFGDFLESSAVSMQEGVGKRTWGTTLSLPSLLETFLVNGRYNIGKGDIVVPDGLDFVHQNSPKDGFWRIAIIKGFPYFEGRGLVKLFDTMIGTPKVKSIDINDDCRSGEIVIENFLDLPFQLLRS